MTVIVLSRVLCMSTSTNGSVKNQEKMHWYSQNHVDMSEAIEVYVLSDLQLHHIIMSSRHCLMQPIHANASCPSLLLV